MRGLVFIFIMLFVANLAHAEDKTGILEITSDPTGAEVFINDRPIGTTPYVDPLIPIGTYKVTAKYGDDFRPQTQTIQVDEVNPVALTFKFKSGLEGDFAGKEEKSLTTEKKKGNVQFASVPMGARSCGFRRGIGHHPVWVSGCRGRRIYGDIQARWCRD